MKQLLLVASCLCITFTLSAQKLSSNKEAIIASVEKHQENLIKISDDIWTLAEEAFQKNQSSKILSDYTEKQGFTFECGMAGMPTAFVATYGSGKPVISILGEFDALPGISQKAQPTKEPLNDGGQLFNVVPDYSRLWVRLRDIKSSGMIPVYKCIMDMAEGAAVMANVDYKISLISAVYEVLVNREGGKIMQSNLELLGPITYTDEEITFSKKT